MKLTISLVKFIFIGALFIISNENLYLSSPQDMSTFFNLFNTWLSHLFSQVTEITGYVVNSEWLPGDNGSIEIG